MHILLTNDDGIFAPGLSALYRGVQDLGEISVVAPSDQQSAVGHAITISNPLSCREVDVGGLFTGHAVAGTPADCVKLAVNALLDKPPDLILSGVNHGPNAGISIIYSGTVSAATEGTILGIPSAAFSIDTFEKAHWETAEKIAGDATKRIIQHGVPAHTLLNINIPNCPYDEISGYAVTRMGKSRFDETFEKRTDPRGNVYYWMDGEMLVLDPTPGTDLAALRDKKVSITPIAFDLTSYDGIKDLEGW